MQSIKNYRIHSWQDNNIHLRTTQGDDGIKIAQFILVDDNGNIDLSEASAVIFNGVKKNNKVCCSKCAIVNAVEGIVELTIELGMTDISGVVNGNIEIITKDGSVKFNGITLNVVADNATKTVVTSNAFSALTDALNKVACITPEGTIAIDDNINDTSANPVQNKILQQALSEKIDNTDGAVSESNIANSAITTSKLAPDSVSTSKIRNGAITYEKIQVGAVAKDKLSESLNNLLGSIVDISLCNVNEEDLWKFGTIINGIEDETSTQNIITKDFIPNSILKLHRTDMTNGIEIKLRIYSLSGEFQEGVSLGSSVNTYQTDYEFDHFNHKYRIEIHKQTSGNIDISKYSIMELLSLKRLTLSSCGNIQVNLLNGEAVIRLDDFAEKTIENTVTNINDISLWESGSINSSTGVNESSNKNIRTKDFISSDIQKIVRDDITGGLEVKLRRYNLDGAYVGNSSFGTDTTIDYELDHSNYKYKLVISRASGDIDISRYSVVYSVVSFIGINPTLLKEAIINPNWDKWNDVRYNYGFDKNVQSEFKTVNGVLESDTMMSVRGGKGRWNTAKSFNGNGGHVFEGWNGDETFRLTELVGKFNKGMACIQMFSPEGLYDSDGRFGWVKIGSDNQSEGIDITDKWAKSWVPFTLMVSSNPPTKVPNLDLTPNMQAYKDRTDGFLPSGTIYYDMNLNRPRVFCGNKWHTLMTNEDVYTKSEVEELIANAVANAINQT